MIFSSDWKVAMSKGLILVLGCALCVAAAAKAQNPAESFEIWRDLIPGDSPDIVANKLSRIDGVKRVKIKPAKNGGNARIGVTYNNSGIEILGERYQISLLFEGTSLKQVALQTGETCIGGMFDRFSRLRSVLVEKYPNEITSTGKLLTASDFSRAQFESTATVPSSVGAFYGNSSVVAMVRITFTRTDPPPSGYTTSALLNSLSALAWNQYRQLEATCNGTGDRKANIQIVYMTKKDFETASDKVIEADVKERQDAASKL